jgi:hypothetical protein
LEKCVPRRNFRWPMVHGFVPGWPKANSDEWRMEDCRDLP